MRKTITTLGLILFCISIYAQTVKLNWGPLYEDKKSNEYIRCYGENENGYFRDTYIKNERVIQKFNNQHQIVASREAMVPLGKLERFYTNFALNNKLYQFAYISKGNIVTLYRKSFTEDLSEESEWEEFDKFNDIRKGIDGGVALGAGYDINIEKSEDNSKFLIYAYKSNNMNSIACLAYDKNLNKIWENEFEVETSKWYKAPTCMITNDGTFIFTGRYELPSSEVKKGKSKINHIIYICDKGGVKNYPLSFDKHYVSDFNFMVNEESKKITVSGFYSDQEIGLSEFQPEVKLVGYFYIQIDLQTKKLEISNTKKFEDLSSGVLKLNNPTIPENRFSKYKTMELKDLKLRNQYKIRKLIKRENSEISMICEYCVVYDELHGNTYRTNLHYGEILVVNFNKEGEMTSAFYIPKNQLQKENENESFLYFLNKDKLTFVYYDSEKNYGTNGYVGEQMPQLKDAALCAVTSDFEGNITNREIFYKKNKADKTNPYMNVINAKKVNDKKYLIQTNTNKNYQCGFLTFE